MPLNFLLFLLITFIQLLTYLCLVLLFRGVDSPTMDPVSEDGMFVSFCEICFVQTLHDDSFRGSQWCYHSRQPSNGFSFEPPTDKREDFLLSTEG